MKFTKLLTAVAFSLIFLASAVFAAASASAAYDYTLTFTNESGNSVNGIGADVYTCSNAACTSMTGGTHFSSATNSILVSYPTPAPTYGYVTFWYSPGYRYKTQMYKPSGSGSSSVASTFNKYNHNSSVINSLDADSSDFNENSEVDITSNVESAIIKNPSHTWGDPNDANLIDNYFSAQTNISLVIRDGSNAVVYSDSALENILRENDVTNTFHWTPDYTQAGTYNATLTTTVVDSKCINSLQRTRSITFTINNVNRAPVAVNDAYSVAEDGVLSIPALGVLANDSDADGDSLTARNMSSPANGVLAFNADGSFAYTPNALFHGTDSFNYVANDGTADGNTATVTITVTHLNHAPVANNDAYSVNEDSALNIAASGVLANDSDVDGDSLTARNMSSPANGALTLNADGSFGYTPNTNFNGVDSFTYVANDGLADSNVATVTINVTPVNDAPILDFISNKTVTEGTLLEFMVTGSDPDGDTTTFSAIPALSGASFDNATGNFSWTPDFTQNGTYEVNFSISDGSLSASQLVTITVNNVNRAPVWSTPIADQNLSEDFGNFVAVVDLRALATDADGDALTFTIADENASEVDCAIAGGTQLELNSVLNWNGLASCTVQVSDGTAGANDTFAITVNPVNDAPVVLNDNYATDEDTLLSIPALGVLANDSDVDGDSLTSILVTDVSNGALTLNADGSFDYTPNADFNGVDSFTYVANDGALNSTPATVTITVAAHNDAPVALNDNYATDEDTALNIAASGVLANDTDTEGSPLTSILVTNVSNGALTLNADGSFDYTPNADYFGTDSFTYVANDGALNSTPATVTITVNAVNDAPVALDDSYSVAEDGSLNIAADGVLANDTDVEGDGLTAILDVNASNGILSFNADGSFDYTPNADFNGIDSFTYLANDGALNSTPATVTIAVNALNDAPVALDDNYATDEDSALNIAASGVLANDTDTEGSPLTAILVTNASNGALTLNADGSFDYMPNTNFNGVDSFTYVANDGTDNSTAAMVTITVNALNDAPVALNDNYATDEDTALNIAADGVLANDTDVEDAITAILVTDVSNGALTLNADGSFSYTPNADWNGIDSFTYVANDGTDNSTAATVTITVDSINDLPVAVDDSYATDEDTALNIAADGVLANDTDTEGDALTAVLLSNVSNGALTLNADGSFDYTPNADFNGVDSFVYYANDGANNSNVATVTITVNSINDAPVALNDNYATNEDSALNIAADGVLANDSDVEDAITAILVADVSNGALNLNADGSFDYTPNADYFGTDSFTYVANDGTDNSTAATVTINVTSVNDAPVALDDAVVTDEDVSVLIDVLANDTDVEDGLPGINNITVGPSNGVAAIQAGIINYTPNADWNGVDSFTYEVIDSNGAVDTAIVTITVNAVNDAPVALNDAYATDEDTPLNVAADGVLANDTDTEGDALTAVLDVDVSNGALTLNADGSFDYTPNADFNGVDSFTYHANDGTDDSNIATVTITVNSINDLPVAVDDSYATDEDTLLSINASLGIFVNDTDVEGDPLTAVLLSDVSNGVLALNVSDGSFGYTPDADFNGVDSFVYYVNDGANNSNVATVTITVNAVNDAPVALDDSYSVAEDGSLNIAADGVLANDTDVEGDALTAVLDVDVSNGALTLNADGSFDYTPNADFNGIDSFTYHANDGTDDSGIATVTITVNSVNDAPAALDDSYVTNEDTALNVASLGILANDTDVDGDNLTAVLDVDVSNGVLTLNANGSFSYAPNADWNGIDSFTYHANDGTDDSNIATVTITVTSVNDAPVALNDAYATDEDSALNIAAEGVLANDTDVEDAITAILVADVSNGALTLNADGSFDYTPNADYFGTDSFTYVANDGTDNSTAATVTITVNAVNDAPTASGIPAQTLPENSGLTSINISSYFSDIDGDSLAFSIIAENAAEVDCGISGDILQMTPATDWNGDASCTVQASDGTDTVSSVVDITVFPVNIINSWIYGGYYPANSSSQVTQTNVTNSTITDSTVQGTPVVNITSSILDNSTLTNVAVINYCQVYDSTVSGGTCDHSYIDPSDIQNSNTSGSTIINSNVYDSNATGSYVEDSSLTGANVDNSAITLGTIDNSTVLGSTVTDSDMANSTVSNGAVIDGSTLNGTVVDNANVTNAVLDNVNATNSIIDGIDLSDIAVYGCNVTAGDGELVNMSVTNLTAEATFTFNGVTKNITEPTPLKYLINFGPTIADLIMLGDGYTGEAVALNATGSADPNIENGTNIAWTFNDTLTYTFEITLDDLHYATVVESNESYPDGLYDGIYNYAFPEPGIFEVTVTVADAFGESIISGQRGIVVQNRPRSGGGGGGSNVCRTNWTCEEWSTCSNGTETRVCTKVDARCDVREAKPEESMICVSEEKTAETNETEDNAEEDNGTSAGIGSKIADAFSGSERKGTMTWIIVIAVLLAAGGAAWLVKKKAKAKTARKSRKK
jgi:VCBS repeat-containing protein